MEPNRSENPFAAPAARVSDFTEEDDGALLSEPARVDAGRGISWLGDAWALFREAPGIWVAIVLVLGIILIVLSMIPLINLAVSIITPVFIGGLMLGCRALQRGESLEFSHLFAGFQSHFGKLALAGLIYAIGVFVIMAGVMVAMVGSMGLGLLTGGGNPADFNPMSILLAVLVAMALIMPLAMAIWFAPALIVLHDMAPMEALTLSFKGCLRNMVPFLLYGIALFVLSIVATIPLGLGWFVLGPVMIASQYVSYREIFVG